MRFDIVVGMVFLAVSHTIVTRLVLFYAACKFNYVIRLEKESWALHASGRWKALQLQHNFTSREYGVVGLVRTGGQCEE